MRLERRVVILVSGLGLYCLGMGFVAGIALERARFDRQRSAVLGRYHEAVRTLHQQVMTFERHAASRDARRIGAEDLE